MIEVEIDFNLRCGVNNQLTFVGWGDVKGDLIPMPGTSVLVVIGESNIVAPGVVVALNKGAGLIYIAVAWLEMQDRSVLRAPQVVE